MLHERLARTKDALAAADTRIQQLESRFMQQTLTAVSADAASGTATRRNSKWVLFPDVSIVDSDNKFSLPTG